MSTLPATLMIRPATRTDWRPLRMLLPEAVHFGARVSAFVAEAEGRILAAAAVSHEVRPQPVPGLRVALHVVPPFRDQGLETQLLDAAASITRAHNLQALYTWGIIPADSPAAQYWQSLGFTPAEHVLEGRTDIAVGLNFIEPFYRKQLDRGRVPAGLTIRLISDVNLARIADLYVQHIGSDRNTILRELQGVSARTFEPDICPVIQLGDHIVGFVLCRRLSDTDVLVDAVVVDTPYRGSWANLLVKRTGWYTALQKGYRTAVYYTHDRHHDTRRFTQKFGTLTRLFLEPYRTLSPLVSAPSHAA